MHYSVLILLQMVIYLLCFDLSKPIEQQREQLGHWFDFLNSALPLPPSSSKYNDTSKLVIIPVGLKSDLQDTSKPAIKPHHLGSWIHHFPRLPIFPHLFLVSSIKAEDRVQELKSVVEGQCNRLFSKYTSLIPTSYRSILRSLQQIPTQPALHRDLLFGPYAHGLTKEGFQIAIQYLSAIGRIVALTNGLVYPNPKVATKIAAKFVSPEEVRTSLLTSDGVEILDERQVGYVLNISSSSNKYAANFRQYTHIFLVSGTKYP